MSTNLSIGVLVGAALASGFGATIGTAKDKLAQLQSKAGSLKIGESVGREFQRLRAEMLLTNKEYVAGGKKNVEMKTRLHELMAKTANAAAAAKKYGFTIRDVAQQTRALGVMSSQAEAQIGRVTARMARAQARSAMKSEILPVIGAVYSLGRAVRPAIEFEEAFADVRKVVDDSDEELNGLRNDLLKMSTVIPMAGTELTKITAAAGQTGMKGRKALLDFTATAAKMGVAFDISAEEAGTAMAEIKNGCKITQAEMASLGDAINHLSNNTAASAPKLVEYMRRVGSVGKLAGMTGEQVAALGTAFIATGTAPEVAARASNDLIMKLSGITKQSKQVREAFQGLGYSDLAQLEKNMLKDPQRTILDFLKKVSGKENKLSILSATIGTGFADDIAKLVNGLGNYETALGLVANKSNYAGSMEREFETRSATTANSIQLLKNQVALAATNLGSVFLPQIADGAQKLGVLVGKFADWAEKNPETVKIIGSVVAGFVAMKAASLGGRIGLSYLSDGGSLLNGAFQKLRPSTIQAGLALLKMKGAGSVAGGVFSILKGNILGFGKTVLGELKIVGAGIKFIGAAAAANPIGAVITAIAIAGLLIWKYWEPIKGFFLKFWPEVKAKWASIGEVIKAPFVSAFGWIGEKIDWFSKKWNALKNTLGLGAKAIGTKGDDVSGIPGHAVGGIFSKPHIAAFAEGGRAEAAIPLEGNRPRALSLFAETGRRLGVATGGGVTFITNLTVNAPAGSDAAAITREVKRMLAEAERRARAKERGRFSDAPVFG